MESQCKERVDLLKALRDSRLEAAGEFDRPTNLSKASLVANNGSTPWLGDGSIAPAQYSDIPSTRPGLPPRRRSSQSVFDTPLSNPPTLPVPSQPKQSRSPSPDQRRPMRTTLRQEKKGVKSPKNQTQAKPGTLKAAGLAWDITTRPRSAVKPESDPTIEARLSAQAARRSIDVPSSERERGNVQMPDPADYRSSNLAATAGQVSYSSRPAYDSRRSQPATPDRQEKQLPAAPTLPQIASQKSAPPPPPPPPHRIKPTGLSYRKEVFPSSQKVSPSQANQILNRAYAQPDPKLTPNSGPALTRKPIASPSNSRLRPPIPKGQQPSSDDLPSASRTRPKARTDRSHDSEPITPPSTDEDSSDDIKDDPEKTEFELRVDSVLTNLPRGIDILFAKQILNEIVVHGDEVHWDDVAGLHSAKKALKEAVVYPFLRPDLFSGLREPARGMLLFGPPGTGKTMLARAVATESRSTFFAITASTLTSKWHGESEKLVRALFALAKAMAPSIIFVDEIDALLSSRGGGTEHEASRRSKTEFLIGWSDLQKAAAGKDTGVGDASRVLVLAATNCPWDIDDAARRRFVRRQYIPLPEPETREVQIRGLLKSQKHSLTDDDILALTAYTDGKFGLNLH